MVGTGTEREPLPLQLLHHKLGTLPVSLLSTQSNAPDGRRDRLAGDIRSRGSSRAARAAAWMECRGGGGGRRSSNSLEELKVDLRVLCHLELLCSPLLSSQEPVLLLEMEDLAPQPPLSR